MEKSYHLLTIEGPFSFEHTFQRHHRTTDTLKSMIVDHEENRFIKWIYVGETPYLLDATIRTDNEKTEVHLNGSVDEHLKADLRHYVRRMFGVDNPLPEFYEHMETIPRIKQLLERFHGMRIITNPDLFETMVDTIIGQQVNLKFAATLKERLVRFAGEIKKHDGADLYLFPTAEKVAKLEYEQLRELSFSQRKSEYIIDFARMVEREEVDLNALWSMSNQEIIDRLLPLRGIGVWTIECLMLFGLNRRDVLPAADIGLRNAVKSLYELEEQPQTDEIRALASEEGWHPWESYITFYMWQYLNTLGK
ncbi:DNA-3-methyladenine glycosylase [Pseudalkalibacillus sp. SCS-8]|uniref:DNA-3-methyladenine glycosylase family protein n=1 Tax=Pseudalkalibacillus nanhaiensis TaxID=3115291 RepID=UPI0032DA693C